MRRTVVAFWIGVVVASAVLIVTTTATTFDADVATGEGQPVRLVQRVDQGAVSRLLAPAALTLGTVRLTKRGWGLVTAYTEEISVARGDLVTQAGGPLDLRVTLEIPGTVVATNADGREGTALVWSSLPRDAALRADTRVVNWSVIIFLVAAAALSFWPRGGPRRARL